MTPMWSADCHRLVVAIHGCGVDHEWTVAAHLHSVDRPVESVDSVARGIRGDCIELGYSIEAQDGHSHVDVLFESDLLAVELADVSAFDRRGRLAVTRRRQVNAGGVALFVVLVVDEHPAETSHRQYKNGETDEQ